VAREVLAGGRIQSRFDAGDGLEGGDGRLTIAQRQAEDAQAQCLHHHGGSQPAHGPRTARRGGDAGRTGGGLRSGLGGFDARPELVERLLLLATGSVRRAGDIARDLRDHQALCGQFRPAIGTRMLASLSPLEIQAAYEAMIDRKLSAGTIRYAVGEW